MRSNKGLTLIEFLIGLGLSSIVVTGLAGQFKGVLEQFYQNQKQSEAVYMSSKVVQLLTNTKSCTESLVGLPFDLESKAPLSVKNLYAISKIKKDGAYAKDLKNSIGVGTLHDGIMLESITLSINKVLSKSLNTYRVDVAYNITNAKRLPVIKPKPFEIHLELDSENKVTSCIDSNLSEVVLKEKFCHFGSDGWWYYDKKEDRCLAKDTVHWHYGTSKYAQCPEGTFPSPEDSRACGSIPGEGFEDSNNEIIEREYENGEIVKKEFSYSVNEFDFDSASCTCHYAVDLPEDDVKEFKCRIRCSKDVSIK